MWSSVLNQHIRDTADSLESADHTPDWSRGRLIVEVSSDADVGPDFKPGFQSVLESLDQIFFFCQLVRVLRV